MSKCFCAISSHFTSLPSTIDTTVAADALRTQRNLFLNLVRHCHLQIADSLFSKKIIPTQVKDKVMNPHLDITERVVALLDCVASRIEAVNSLRLH